MSKRMAPLAEPTPDAGALRALAIRQGLARGLLGLGLALGFTAAYAAIDGSGSRSKDYVSVLGFGGCIGLGLFAQALLEHALRAPHPRSWHHRAGISLACWSFAGAIVTLALAQAVSLPHLLEGNPERGMQQAFNFCYRLLIDDPAEGFPIVLCLGSPLALHSLFELGGWPVPGLRSCLVANTAVASLIYLFELDSSFMLHAFLAVAAVGLPVFRYLGDRLETLWTQRSAPA